MKTATLMIQGATSDAGKSILVAGLCRLMRRRGIKVAPFKPQNMALNSAVTAAGGEIGRAQALQAQAAGLEPHSDMNPVLLKPNDDTSAQVIIQGQALNHQDAASYHDYKRFAMAAVLESYHRLAAQHELILVEGAGSPAEINLRDNDIANMGFAEAIDCPVILIADIDRGGVFAHLVGTLALLSATERARIQGFVINRFRGDIGLLQSGIDWLEQETGKPVLGVIPYLQQLHLDAEDALTAKQHITSDKPLKVIVPVLPRISNHTDFDPLRLHPQVDLRYIPTEQPIPPSDLIILPGSKNVRADLAWLRQQGWTEHLHQHLRYGGKLLGICGGYQMLGQRIDDPSGIEGEPGHSAGLGLLAMRTVLEKEKQLTQVSGALTLDNAKVTGYEIHLGRTEGKALERPAIILDERPDGAISRDNRIMGTYLHGLFDEPGSLTALLNWAGLEQADSVDITQIRESNLNRLADTLEECMDFGVLEKFIK